MKNANDVLETLEMLEPLVTLSRTRNIVERSSLVSPPFRKAERRSELLEKLAAQLIVRVEQRLGGQFVEITHEFLIESILTKIRTVLSGDPEYGRFRWAIRMLESFADIDFRSGSRHVLDAPLFRDLNAKRDDIEWNEWSLELMLRSAIVVAAEPEVVRYWAERYAESGPEPDVATILSEERIREQGWAPAAQPARARPGRHAGYQRIECRADRVRLPQSDSARRRQCARPNHSLDQGLEEDMPGRNPFLIAKEYLQANESPRCADALTALAALGDPQSRAVLAEAATTEDVAEVRSRAQAEIASMPADDAQEVLKLVLEGLSVPERQRGVYALLSELRNRGMSFDFPDLSLLTRLKLAKALRDYLNPRRAVKFHFRPSPEFWRERFWPGWPSSLSGSVRSIYTWTFGRPCFI